jgi:hypothetical protein
MLGGEKRSHIRYHYSWMTKKNRERLFLYLNPPGICSVFGKQCEMLQKNNGVWKEAGSKSALI